MIPLYKPHMPKLPELDKILHSGQLAYGTYAKAFERSLEEFIGCESGHVLVTSSFNMTIAVVTSLLDIDSHAEVIASPMACLASTQPFASQGIQIRWADVDPRTGTLLPESVIEKITPRTKAIIHNHFCGYPGYIDEINSIGKEYGITIIDDCIEAFGSEYRGKRIGNCGADITIFSFNAVRLPNTIDGGAILIKDAKLVRKAELIRDCGIDRRIFRDDLGEISPMCDITLTGYSATMSDVNGYIGLCQMKDMDDILRRQRKNAMYWDKLLETRLDMEGIKRDEISPNYWVYGLLVGDKRAVIKEFRNEGWYASGVHINNNIYSIFGQQAPLPGVEKFYKHFVAIPSGWWVMDIKEEV